MQRGRSCGGQACEQHIALPDRSQFGGAIRFACEPDAAGHAQAEKVACIASDRGGQQRLNLSSHRVVDGLQPDAAISRGDFKRRCDGIKLQSMQNQACKAGLERSQWLGQQRLCDVPSKRHVW